MLDLINLSGFFSLETDSVGPFRWSKDMFHLALPPGEFKFATLEFANNVHNNFLILEGNGESDRHPLLLGWQRLDVPVTGSVVSAKVGVAFRPDGDSRELGIALRSVIFHSDPELHDLINCRRDNFGLNAVEFAEGREIVKSFPPYLRITLSKTCNIANESACVYCAWDWAKDLEKGSPDMTPAFLQSLGGFERLATSVTDCSVGEPPLEIGFAEQIDAVTKAGRSFEFTSNGQTLSRKKRALLLGRPIRVYVSIDSATREGYARYRDQRFNLIVSNLRSLVEEKRTHNNLPELIVSFVVMRSNMHECAAFLDLMQSVGADFVKFRALSIDEPVTDLIARRGGHYFDYHKECLSVQELSDLGAKIRQSASQYTMPVIMEWDSFVNEQPDVSGSLPICSEPWKTVYILGRGIMPCCYGRSPMALWHEIDTTGNLETAIAEVFNNQAYRALRHDLAKGVLPEYCKNAHACPITKVHNSLEISAIVGQP